MQEPEWKELGTVRSVPIFQLMNPEKHQMFFWKPCDWTQDPACEQAVFEGGLAPPSPYGGIVARVYDDGEKTRVATLVTRTEIVSISNEEGEVSLAFTNGGNGIPYSFGSPRLYKDLYAIPVYKKESPVPGGILGKDADSSPFLFEPKFDEPYLWAVTAQSFALGPKRWAWWHGQAAMLSWDNETGPPAALFSKTKSNPDKSPYSIRNVIAAGDHFVSVEVFSEGQYLRSVPVISDGIQKASPFFPLLPNTTDDSPMFDGANILWFRGTGYVSNLQSEKVELWAYKMGDKNGQPYKVLDLPEPWTVFNDAFVAGGHGWVSFWTGTVKQEDGSFSPVIARLVHVESKKQQVIELPGSIYRGAMCGISREHVWFTVDEETGYWPGRKFVRWKLPSPKTLP
jgi:hypothetical protein